MCGEEDLGQRTRLGIWLIPDKFVLKPKPEELMELRLDLFLRCRLKGYLRMDRQVRWEDKGRVDLLVIMSDGYEYVVEIKWLGRALKSTRSEFDAKEFSQAIGDNWTHEFVTIMGEGGLDDAFQQLAAYLQNDSVSKGYLVVYDCRKPKMITALDERSFLPSPPLPSYRFRFLHVAVSPIVPSSSS
jgi:hypothetical protein